MLSCFLIAINVVIAFCLGTGFLSARDNAPVSTGSGGGSGADTANANANAHANPGGQRDGSIGMRGRR